MTTMTTIYNLDLDSALTDEIIGAAYRILRGRVAYDSDGDSAGIIYMDDATHRYYAADLDDLRDLIDTAQREQRGDAYSIWCAARTVADYASEAEAATAMDWAL